MPHCPATVILTKPDTAQMGPSVNSGTNEVIIPQQPLMPRLH